MAVNPFDKELLTQFDPLSQSRYEEDNSNEKEYCLSAQEKHSALQQLDKENTGCILDLEYDNSKVVELFEDENSCPICFEIFCSRPPRQVVDCPFCRVSFCKGCLQKSCEEVTDNHCPHCKQSLNISKLPRNIEKEKSIAYFPGCCIYCKVQMARGELVEHEVLCKDKTLMEFSSSNNNFLDDRRKWSCPRCTFLNHETLSLCEICGTSHDIEDQNRSSQEPDFFETFAIPPASQGYCELLSGTMFVRVQTKKFFKKWKPVRYILSNGSLKFLEQLHQPSLVGEASSTVKIIHFHQFMGFGKIRSIQDAKVTEKKNDAENHKLVRQTSVHSKLFAARLFQNPLSVLEKDFTLLRNGRFQPKPGYYELVAHIALEDPNELRKLIKAFSHVLSAMAHDDSS